MKMRAEALLFDDDGTLASSMASVYRCTKELLSSLPAGRWAVVTSATLPQS
ncbi:hypothetical protein ABZ958_20505 [Streptomyces sp. NPDC046237]|uniref:hypothetical protein n=1 Tax=Streptomyces sp. NPDC046237 TaxID=3154914 RepID=UPI0033F07314